MKRTILFIFLIAASLLVAGCVEENGKNPTEVNLTESAVVEVTDLTQINEALQDGPIFLKLGAEWCSPCRAMKPIMAEMADKYEGKATIMAIDTEKSPKLASYFGVYSIPDSCVIVDLENEEYLYMQMDGNTTKNRYQARIMGLKKKEVFESVLDQALLREEKKKAE